MQDRLETIEIKLAYQEDSLQQLNDIITEQQETIQRLELMVLKLAERLRNVSEHSSLGALDPLERPPHY